MKPNHLVIITLILMLILPACSTRPSWVLPEKKMENVLFDLHIAEADVENNYSLYHDSEGHRQKLLDAVFLKHKITEQQFDTSLVWYNAHLDRYLKIYDAIGKRYVMLSDTLQSEIDVELREQADLNRVNIWHGSKTYLLLPASQAANTFTFNLDSIEWNGGDKFEVAFNALGIRDSIRPEVLFYVTCEDTVMKIQKQVDVNGAFSSMITPGMYKVKAVSGFVHVPAEISNVQIVLSQFGIFQHKQGNVTAYPSPQ